MKKYILITRPKEEARELEKSIKTIGFEAFIESLLDIVILDNPLPPPDDINILISTSKNALKLNFPNEFFEKKLYVVGKHSEQYAKIKGFINIIKADETSLGLQKLLLKENKNKRLLYLAGEVIFSDLDNILKKNGYNIQKHIVYKSLQAKELSGDLIDFLAANQFFACLFYSKRTAEAFVNLIHKHKIENKFINSIAICLSEVIKSEVDTICWKQITITKDVEKHLQELYEKQN